MTSRSASAFDQHDNDPSTDSESEEEASSTKEEEEEEEEEEKVEAAGLTSPPLAAKKPTPKPPAAPAGDDDVNSKKPFQRLWSEQDEIAILNGWLEYSAETGSDPYSDMKSFHGFIEKSLHIKVTRPQLVDKIYRLRKKYANGAIRARRGGNPKVWNSHDERMFELAKKVWENAAEGIELIGSKDAASSSSLTETEMIRLHKTLGSSGLNEDAMRMGWELIGPSKRAKLEDRWRELLADELELFVKRAKLVTDQASLMLNALRSSG